MKGIDRIRQLIAKEAARLMYEEGIKEYRDAKRKAGKPFGSDKALSLGSHLPSNAEIHEELRALLELHEEEELPGRLLELRLTALRYLELFAPFTPYLVGSVLSGVVTSRSDIDLHLFADDPEEVENFLRAHEIPYETELVSIRKGGAFHDYSHIYIDDKGVTVECSVYPTAERHKVSKSSITGRPMERAGAKALRRLIGDMLPAQGEKDLPRA